MRAEQIYEYINAIAPFTAQEDWDNSGFQVGERTKEVQKILFALDATADLVREAVEFHCDLIVTHHPFLFHPQKQFLAESPAFQAAKHNIAVISAHTSYDCAAGGVNDILAETVGLSDIRTSDCGMFRIGTVPAQSAKDFAKAVKSALQTQVSVSLPEKSIQRVAVCGGAGADFMIDAKAQGADLFLTGEAKHHEILDAAALGISIVCAGHFETEWPAVRALCARVQAQFPQTECILSEQTSPIFSI